MLSFRSTVREFVRRRRFRLFLLPRTLSGACDLWPRRLLTSCQSMQGMLVTTGDTCQGLVGTKTHLSGVWEPWVSRPVHTGNKVAENDDRKRRQIVAGNGDYSLRKRQHSLRFGRLQSTKTATKCRRFGQFSATLLPVWTGLQWW